MKSWVFLGLLSACLLSCQAKVKPATQASKGSEWAGRMQGLASEVRTLIPYLYSRTAFVDAKNRKQVIAGLDQLANQSHALKPEMGQALFGNDPMLAYSLESMQADVKRASEAFKSGQTEYARGVAKSVMGHCFRCHSIQREGSAAVWDISQFQSLELQPLEKVDLLIATRKYSDAISSLEGLLSNSDYMQNFPFDFESALRKYLSLMIRVENNPNRALSELDRVLEMKSMPVYVGEQAKAWRQSLIEWKTHLKKPVAKSNLLAEARRRIQRAADQQQYIKDHAGDVEFLRATALLHDFLRDAKDAKQIAEAHYMLGQAYEVLDELGYWNLHEIYYESCIKTQPKSALAKQCYSRLEASVYMGFSGSSGVHIPGDERQRLKKLKEMLN